MAGKEKLFAQFTMMNYLQGGRDRTVQEICEHLRNNTDWGQAQLREGGVSDLGERNVQNWLKDIRESAEFARSISFRTDPNNRRRILYSSRAPAIGERIMPIEEACLVLMAEKFLQAAIPADFIDAGLQELFLAARARLKKLNKQPRQQRKRIREYLNRIAIEQRGQALVEQAIPYDVLGRISRAILEGRTLECRYRGKARELHPFGIVLKSPKVYLLAADDRVIRRIKPNELKPVLFLCARITDVAVSKSPNLVPDAFDVQKLVAANGFDVDSRDPGLPTKAFLLKLRLFDAESDNLLEDLRAFPLSEQQTIEPEKGTPHYLLTAKRMRATHQLMEWIMGRLERVEVLEPASLRHHVIEKLDAMRANYT